MTTTQISRPRRASPGRGRKGGWMPQQHGAWAMLIVPWLVGLVLAGQADAMDAGRILLGPAWLLGYLCFNAATLMTKAAPVRRPRYRAPLLAYGISAAVLGAMAIVLGGVEVLWWGVVGVALVGVALLLTQRKLERSLLAGVVSIIAGTGVGVVTRFWGLSEIPTAAPHELATLGFVTAYFVGTVFTVKTMIRQRGSRGWLAASIGYHLVLLVAAVLTMGLGWLGWPWVVLAVLLLARAVGEPLTWAWARASLSVLQIGMIEMVLSAFVLVAAVIG